MKAIIATIAAIIFFTCSVKAQPGIDSLKKAIRQENDASQKVELLFQLCDKYKNINPDSCFSIALQVIRLLRPANDSGRISKAEWYITSYYDLTGHPDSALMLAQRNINWLINKPALQSLLAQFYSSSGLFYMKLDRQKDALDRFYIALQTAERCNDFMTQLKARVNIGWARMELNQYEQAIDNFITAIALIRERNLSGTVLGVIYNNLASSYNSLKKVDSAYKYAQIAIESARAYHDIAAEANGLFILGTVQEKMNRLQDALQSFLQAQPLRKQIGDPFFIVSDLAELSTLYSKLGKTKEGIATAHQALEIARKNDISAKFSMIYEAFAANYEKAKDYENMAAMYKKISELKDSTYADANPKALAEMQTKYETEKKERIIEQQHNHIVTQNSFFIGIATLALMIGLLVYSQYNKYKLRKEAQLQAEVMRQQELATRAVIKAEEEERQRIARDLHDGIGQMMSAARMNLSAFESETQFGSEVQKKSFEQIVYLVDDSCKELRQVSHNMMPNALLKSNLTSAIHDFTDKLDKKSLEIHLFSEGLDERLDSNTETILYRVIQECVNNVIKHAGATTLDISVIRDKEGISATIEDNGKGFDTSDKGKFEGIGLKNIFTRVEFLKGTVEFDSATGRGTAVSIQVPLPDNL
jgi:signal transduction histidine kinase